MLGFSIYALTGLIMIVIAFHLLFDAIHYITLVFVFDDIQCHYYVFFKIGNLSF